MVYQINLNQKEKGKWSEPRLQLPASFKATCFSEGTHSDTYRNLGDNGEGWEFDIINSTYK
jgi:hypothetical protein